MSHTIRAPELCFHVFVLTLSKTNLNEFLGRVTSEGFDIVSCCHRTHLWQDTKALGIT